MSMSDRDALRRWQHAGLDCAMIDSQIGFINGYVRLPEGHVGRHAGYDQLNRTITAHGGLTYGADEDGWVGFDTGHSGDAWPGLSDPYNLHRNPLRAWDLDLLTAEVESLAEQLAAMTTIGQPESSWDCTADEFRVLLRQAKAWQRVRAARGGAR